MSPEPRLSLSVLPDVLAVSRLPSDATPPAWAEGGSLVAVVRTADELSVVCAETRVPDGVPREGGWRVLRVAGPIPFEVPGVLASLTGPLARAGIPLFAISTYDTDYVLIREAALARAVAILREAGHQVS